MPTVSTSVLPACDGSGTARLATRVIERRLASGVVAAIREDRTGTASVAFVAQALVVFR
jgi:hypothetical protein